MMSETAIVPVAPILVDMETAAGMLSVSPSTVRRLVQAGELVRVKIGRRALLSVAAIHNWVDTQVVLQGTGEASLEGAYHAIESMARERLEALDPFAAEPLESAEPTRLVGGQYL
jgi:excisionase family DNA binding protein